MEKLQQGSAALDINLTQEQLAIFETYYRELIAWNRKINLTAITAYEDVQVKHFLDSLTAVLVYGFKDNLSVIDIGTGAGFPGIPVKIAFPGIRLTLLEATAKKTKFLESIVQTLGLSGVEVFNGRAEETAHEEKYREKFDVVLSRAVSALPSLAEIALPFCAIGGIFIAYKKGDVTAEINSAGKAVGLMGGRLKGITPVSRDLFDDDRCLVTIEKLNVTPPGYPRRPGIPEKRPLLP